MLKTTLLPTRSPRRLPAALLAAGPLAVSAGTAAGALSAVPASAAPVPAAAGTCPATFRVLHDDHIGQLAIPKGAYTITTQGIDLRARRQPARGVPAGLRRPPPGTWAVDPAAAAFVRGATGAGFTLAPARGPPTPAGRRRDLARGRQCPGTFQVDHDDRIGTLRLPAGPYRMTIAASGRPGCRAGARLLARFLDRPDGRLPGAWTVDARTGTFAKGDRRIPDQADAGELMPPFAEIVSVDPFADRMQPGPGAAFVVLVAFLLSFLAIRTSARLTRSVSWWPGGLETDGGVHIHHLVWGIGLTMLCGFIAFARPARRAVVAPRGGRLRRRRRLHARRVRAVGPARGRLLARRGRDVIRRCRLLLRLRRARGRRNAPVRARRPGSVWATALVVAVVLRSRWSASRRAASSSA